MEIVSEINDNDPTIHNLSSKTKQGGAPFFPVTDRQTDIILSHHKHHIFTWPFVNNPIQIKSTNELNVPAN